MTKLYFCSASNPNGDNLDYLVEATDGDQALDLFTTHLDEGEWDHEAPYRVWEVPALAGKPCVYNWNEDDEGNGHPGIEGVIGAISS